MLGHHRHASDETRAIRFLWYLDHKLKIKTGTAHADLQCYLRD